MNKNWITSILWNEDEPDVPAASHQVSQAVQSRMELVLAAGDTQINAAIEVGIHGLEDPDYRVRKFSARMLGALGEKGQPAIPSLLTHLDEKNGYASSAIKRALVLIGPIGIPQIVDVMKRHPNSKVRARCAHILSGKLASIAFDDLREASVNDVSPDVRFRAALALRAIRPHENPAVLEAILVNADHNDRGGYSWTGGQISSRGTYTVNLWRCLLSNNETIRKQTFELVKQFQLYSHEPLAKSWGRAGEFEVTNHDDPSMLVRRLEALTLLDEHLHFHVEFLKECADFPPGPIHQLAIELLQKLAKRSDSN